MRTPPLIAVSLLLSPATLLAQPGHHTEAAVESVSKRIVVGVGQQTVFHTSNLTRVALGNQEVADVHVASNGEILVTGKAEGHTTLILWHGNQHETREITVSQWRGSEIQRQIRSLPGTEDLKVDEMSGKVIVQGVVPTPGDLDNLHALLKDEANVTLLVRVEPAGRKLLVERINAALSKAGLHTARATLVGNRIFLEGQVQEETDVKRAELIANSIAGESVERMP